MKIKQFNLGDKVPAGSKYLSTNLNENNYSSVVFYFLVK
jgi:hypothetical protein